MPYKGILTSARVETTIFFSPSFCPANMRFAASLLMRLNN